VGLRAVIQQRGLFCALFSDRASHFFVTEKAGEPVDKYRLTQVGRALKELGIHMIPVGYRPPDRALQFYRHEPNPAVYRRAARRSLPEQRQYRVPCEGQPCRRRPHRSHRQSPRSM
jgi:hypothetical protein